MTIRLSKAQKVTVSQSGDLYPVMQSILLRENKIQRGQEHFWVVGLNNANQILYIELIALGGQNRVHANPPDVFRMGIYKLAVSVILVHNHPSGSLQITPGDRESTDRFLKVGQLINIEVLDHLVITEKHYASFADLGIMEELKHSGLFEIVGTERKALEAWKLKEEAKRSEKQKAKEIAKRMKAKGYDVATIKELTGLSKAAINKL